MGGSSAGARSRVLEGSSGLELSLPSKRVALVLDSIPVELLARAAFQCGAHARALLYFETHVRAKESGALNPAAARNASYSDEDVSFFQVWSSCAPVPMQDFSKHSPNECTFKRLGNQPRGCTCMQEVYGKLEEPDGLSGLVRLRSGGPRLEDQVFLPTPHVLIPPCASYMLMTLDCRTAWMFMAASKLTN